MRKSSLSCEEIVGEEAGRGVGSNLDRGRRKNAATLLITLSASHTYTLHWPARYFSVHLWFLINVVLPQSIYCVNTSKCHILNQEQSSVIFLQSNLCLFYIEKKPCMRVPSCDNPWQQFVVIRKKQTMISSANTPPQLQYITLDSLHCLRM